MKYKCCGNWYLFIRIRTKNKTSLFIGDGCAEAISGQIKKTQVYPGCRMTLVKTQCSTFYNREFVVVFWIWVLNGTTMCYFQLDAQGPCVLRD